MRPVSFPPPDDATRSAPVKVPVRLRDLASASPAAAVNGAEDAPLDFSSDGDSSDSSFNGHEAPEEGSESDEDVRPQAGSEEPSWVAAGESCISL